MHRLHAAAAARPLLAATLALAASLALGASASGTPVPASPAASLDAHSQVEGVTTANPTDVALRGAAASALGQAARGLGWVSPPTSAVAAATTTPTPRAQVGPSQPWWSRYQGTNDVWMPTLGVSHSVSFYACSRTTYPANDVYRWGCAGADNVYLFGHNFGLFNPLYEAWRNGTLKKGLPVVYADGSGQTRLYRVTTWLVVNDTDTAWATASQSRPSMTLQTCAAVSGPLRLVVRLVVAAS